MTIEPIAVARALRRGIATLDALAARTGAGREEVLWALDEAAAQGWVAVPEPDCEGLCGSQVPAVYRLTEAGRQAVSRA